MFGWDYDAYNTNASYYAATNTANTGYGPAEDPWNSGGI